MRKDIKAKLRQEAASLNVPFTLEETKKRLPDAIEVVEHPKRKRKAAWAIPLLSGSAAVIALSVGLGVGLNRPSTPGGSSSVTLPAIPYSLNEKELSSFGFQALSAVSMYDGPSASALARRGRLISQSEAEAIAGEVVEYMDMVSSFANRDGFSFVYDDDSGFEIFFGSQVVYDLDFAETDLGGGDYSYEGTISSAETGVSYRLYGEKEAEVDGDETKEEIEVVIYEEGHFDQRIVSTQEMEKEGDELESSFSYKFYSGERIVKTVEYESEIEGRESETELTISESGIETSVSFTYFDGNDTHFECEFEKEGDRAEAEANMQIRRLEDGRYEFRFEEGGITVII